MAQEKPETSIILPRDYGVVIQSGSNNIFYDPATYAIGLTMLMTQAELQRALRTWQDYKRDETERFEQGNLGYTPAFRTKGIEGLMSADWQEAEEEILKGISRKEGAKNLWVIGGKEALVSPKIYGSPSVLHSKVKSKKKGYYNVHITNPFLTQEGFVQHSDIYCSDPGNNWERGAKHLMSMCTHAAALETAQYLQLKAGREFGINYGKMNVSRRDPTLAFNLVSSNYLSNLLMDILIARYVRKESLFNINRKLMSGEIRDAIFDPSLDNTAKTGKVRYAVMRQDTAEFGRSKSYQEDENQWLRKVRAMLAERDYEKMPFYVIAFPGSDSETISERWESRGQKGKIVEIACSPDDAPLVIRKNLEGDVKFHNSAQPYEGNPFLNMGVSERSFDSCTARDCTQFVVGLDDLMKIGSSGRQMAKDMQTHYRGSIARARRKEQDRKSSKQLELF